MGRCGGWIFAPDPGAAFGSLQQGSDGLILQFTQIEMQLIFEPKISCCFC